MSKRKNNSKKSATGVAAAAGLGMGLGFGQAIPAKTPQTSFFAAPFTYIHEHINYLNSSKFFAGVVMIMLNIGSKFISIQFSKSTEEYLKFTLSRQLLIFAMAWMGTRDIYTALGLTAIFVILSDHLFNEESEYCIVPHEKRVLNTLIDTNEDSVVSETELNSAIAVLEKAKKDKQRQEQLKALNKFKAYNEDADEDNELKQLKESFKNKKIISK
jgi:hypothetical protein